MFIFFFLYLTLHVPLSCFCPFSSSLYTQRVLSRFAFSVKLSDAIKQLTLVFPMLRGS